MQEVRCLRACGRAIRAHWLHCRSLHDAGQGGRGQKRPTSCPTMLKGTVCVPRVPLRIHSPHADSREEGAVEDSYGRLPRLLSLVVPPVAQDCGGGTCAPHLGAAAGLKLLRNGTVAVELQAAER